MKDNKEKLSELEESVLSDEYIFQESLSDEELTELEKREVLLRDVKSRLPMLYTVYGNVIKNNPPRVSSANFRALNEKIDSIKFQKGHTITVEGVDWELTISSGLADLLRELGQIEHLVLAGWKLV